MAGAINKGETMEKSEIEKVLSDERRRLIIEFLKEKGRPVSVDQLADYIAEEETGESPSPPHVRETVFEDLYTRHIPKLEEVGVVNHEQEIELDDSFQGVSMYLDVVRGSEISWSEFYLAISVIGIALVSTHIFEVAMVSTIDTEIYALIILWVIAVTSLYQTYTNKVL